MPQVLNYPFPPVLHLRLELPLHAANWFSHSVSSKVGPGEIQETRVSKLLGSGCWQPGSFCTYIDSDFNFIEAGYIHVTVHNHSPIEWMIQYKVLIPIKLKSKGKAADCISEWEAKCSVKKTRVPAPQLPQGSRSASATASLKPVPTGVRRALRTELDLLISWSLRHSLHWKAYLTVEALYFEESRLPGEHFPFLLPTLCMQHTEEQMLPSWGHLVLSQLPIQTGCHPFSHSPQQPTKLSSSFISNQNLRMKSQKRP